MPACCKRGTFAIAQALAFMRDAATPCGNSRATQVLSRLIGKSEAMMRFLLATAVTAMMFGSAHASSGTPEDDRACSASVKRYCSAVVQGGDFAILACLQQNRTRIAPACQRVLIKYGQ